MGKRVILKLMLLWPLGSHKRDSMKENSQVLTHNSTIQNLLFKWETLKSFLDSKQNSIDHSQKVRVLEML